MPKRVRDGKGKIGAEIRPVKQPCRVSSRECFFKTWASMKKHSAAFKHNAFNGLRSAFGVFHQDWENTPPLRFRELIRSAGLGKRAGESASGQEHLLGWGEGGERRWATLASRRRQAEQDLLDFPAPHRRKKEMMHCFFPPQSGSGPLRRQAATRSRLNGFGLVEPRAKRRVAPCRRQAADQSGFAAAGREARGPAGTQRGIRQDAGRAGCPTSGSGFPAGRHYLFGGGFVQ
jgi:hypothetical protein